MKAHRVFVFGLATVSLIYAQSTVNLSGTLMNQFSNPMVSATVQLLGSSLTATTSSTGSFTLSGMATSISRAGQAQARAPFNINVRGGNFEISIEEPTKANVECFDARGMLIGAAQFSEGKTSAVGSFTGKAFNAFFARVNVGSRTYIKKFVSANHSNSQSPITSYQSSDKSSYAKQAAASAAGQLIISHASYIYDTVDISTLTGSVTVTVNIPDLSKGPFTTLWPKGGEVLSKSQTIWLVVGVNIVLCTGDNAEFYCQVSKNAGLSWTGLSSTCHDGTEAYPCQIEWMNTAYWDPNNINPSTPGYFMYMDQKKNYTLCFYRCNLANFVGTTTAWMAESRYCGPSAYSGAFTVQ